MAEDLTAQHECVRPIRHVHAGVRLDLGHLGRGAEVDGEAAQEDALDGDAASRAQKLGRAALLRSDVLLAGCSLVNTLTAVASARLRRC